MDYIDLLTNPGEAGIFLSPPDAGVLDAAAERAGLTRWRVDLAHIGRKHEAIGAFQSALEFADGFGANWDALRDALAERALGEPAGVALTLAHCRELARTESAVFEQLLSVLDAVADDCYDEDIPFWVFIDGVSTEDFDLPTLGEE